MKAYFTGDRDAEIDHIRSCRSSITTEMSKLMCNSTGLSSTCKGQLTTIPGGNSARSVYFVLKMPLQIGGKEGGHQQALIIWSRKRAGPIIYGLNKIWRLSHNVCGEMMRCIETVRLGLSLPFLDHNRLPFDKPLSFLLHFTQTHWKESLAAKCDMVSTSD